MSSPSAPWTSLIEALRREDITTAHSVLSAHPELKSHVDDPLEDHFGPTMLMVAASRKKRAVVDFLLEAGADINRRSHWWAGSFGILDSASEMEDYLISRGAKLDIHSAARLGRLGDVQRFVAQDPRLVNARGGDGQTPLHFAGTVEAAAYLLDHGADINALDIDHESTPAQWMIDHRQPIVRILIERGCRTDILMAAALGDWTLVEKHLERDPDSIHMVVSEKHFPKKNPKAGGSIYIWTLGQGKSPHRIARDFGHKEVFEKLMQVSPPELQLLQAFQTGGRERVQGFLDGHPAIVRQIMQAHPAALARAAQDNSIEQVQLMLLAGWPLDSRGQHRATALHWAAFHGNLALAEFLVRAGAALEVRDNDFQSRPLDWAIHGSQNGWCQPGADYPGTVRKLIEAGSALPPKVGGTPEVRAVLRAFGLRE